MIKRMFPIKTIVGFLTLGILLASVPTFASANTVASNEEKVVLLGQIERLLAEVVRLQALLEKQRQRSASLSYTGYVPYEAVFFNRPFESIYLVEGGQLLSTDNNSSVGRVDKQLFDFFSSVVGKDVVSNKVKEWRVFNDSTSDLGAFVELISGTEDWIVGVNRYNFSNDKQVKKSFANLFIHEYSHIILFSNPVLNENFKSKFWTTLDYQHQVIAEAASDAKRFDILGSYFDINKDRFVSDYATLSPDEDMAETFVSFVLEPKPVGYTVSERKILFFYEKNELIDLREKLRTNLKTLEVL